MIARFRFYAELNDFLPSHRRQVEFPYQVQGKPSIKDAIEALGIPHTEVDLILVDDRSVDFSYHLRDGDRVSVYPVFESIDITPLVRLRPAPLREVRFILDTHLGRLAGYLRMLGLDTLYDNEYSDDTLARISSEEKRILLTKDRGLLKRNVVTHGYCVRSTNPRQKLVEVLRRFDLLQLVKPFSRCIRCNGLLEEVAKGEILEELPPKVRIAYDEFRRCRECGQVYWRGTHYERMRQLIGHVLQEVRANEIKKEIP